MSSSQDWWSRAIRGQEAPVSAPLPRTPIAMPRTQPYRPPAPVEDRCPECGSGNYLTAKRPARCFDCGYTALGEGREFRNSSQGMVGDGPATPAHQVPVTPYVPNTVIGKVE